MLCGSPSRRREANAMQLLSTTLTLLLGPTGRGALGWEREQPVIVRWNVDPPG